jgi:hypothetical protein
MHFSRYGLAVCSASFLAGCVTLQPPVLNTAKPIATSGYVAGIFSRSAGPGWGYALGLVENRGGNAYTMAFDEASRTVPARQTTSMIELPPGEYRVAYWTTYGWLFKQQASRKDLPAEHVLARPFTVKQGQVVVIGHLLASTEELSGRINWSIVPQKARESEVVASFRRAFPGFEQAPVECLLCLRDGERKLPASAGSPPRQPATAPRP